MKKWHGAVMDDQFGQIRESRSPGQEALAGNDRAASEQIQLEHAQQTFQSELGLIGRLLGGRREKPGNISGLGLILCFLVLLIAYGCTAMMITPGEAPQEEWRVFEHMFTGFISVITLILGYLFGSGNRS